MGHVLQMVVHLVFHVKDDPLRDPGVDVALQHRDHLGGRQRDKGQDQQTDQQGHVLPHQGLVDDAAGDDAGQQAQHRRNQDRHENQQELEPVRPEIGQDPPDQGTAEGRQVFLFLFRQEPPGAQTVYGRRHFPTAFLSETGSILWENALQIKQKL